MLDKIETCQFWKPEGTNMTVCVITIEGVAFCGTDQISKDLDYDADECQQMALKAALGEAQQVFKAFEEATGESS